MAAGPERRKAITALLKASTQPIPGYVLSEKFGVSRQIIVRDIALIKESGLAVVSTNRGYYVDSQQRCSRVLKVRHSDEDTRDELQTIVALGGVVVDVFVKHRVYGELRANLQIATPLDIDRFMEDLRSGKSTPLKNVTASYHYHTIEAPSEEVLDAISEALRKKRYLAERLFYEKE